MFSLQLAEFNLKAPPYSKTLHYPRTSISRALPPFRTIYNQDRKNSPCVNEALEKWKIPIFVLNFFSLRQSFLVFPYLCLNKRFLHHKYASKDFYKEFALQRSFVVILWINEVGGTRKMNIEMALKSRSHILDLDCVKLCFWIFFYLSCLMESFLTSFQDIPLFLSKTQTKKP